MHTRDTGQMHPAELRRRRRALGLTQRALAEALGVAANTVARWERGTREIGQPQLVRFALERFETAAPSAATKRTHLPDASGRLPAPPNSFVGRARELEDVSGLLRRSDVHLVTVSGFGGVGKTRLAVESARSLTPELSDGAVFVDLSAATNADDLESAIARAVGVQDLGTHSLRESLVQWLKHREMVLVLDNFEHLRGHSDLLATLLETCPGLKLLVTSRVATELEAEVEYRLTGLACPTAGAEATPEWLAEVPAVALFLDRALAVTPTFDRTAPSLRSVAELTRRLDGSPLAIELAAARCKFASAREVLGRFDEQLEFLVSNQSDRPARHHSLRASLEWSFEQLTADQQSLLSTLAVFSGACTEDALRTVHSRASAPAWEWDPANLECLVEQSFVQVDSTHAPATYALADTIRDYARGRLDRDTLARLSRAHAAYFLEFAEMAHDADLAPSVASLDALERELPNLRTALHSAIDDAPDGEVALRLCVALLEVWWLRGYLREGVRWTSAALEMARAPHLTGGLRGRALYASGQLRMVLNDPRCVTAFDEALALFEADGDHLWHARVLTLRAYALLFQGQVDAASDVLQPAVLELTEAGLERSEFQTRFLTGLVAYARGNFDGAAHILKALLADVRHSPENVAYASTLGQLGFLSWARLDVDAAYAYSREALVAFLATRNNWGVALCLAGIARAAALHGDWPRVVRLSAAAEAMRIRTGAAAYPQLSWAPMAVVESAREHVSPETFERQWAAGGRLSIEDAVHEALAIPRPTPLVARTQTGTAGVYRSLTRRERQVARLVAQGLSNREVAHELNIAERTVETHLEQTFAKLGVRSRAQLATLVPSATAVSPRLYQRYTVEASSA